MATEAAGNAKTERTPGTTILPLARVKRVIKEDKDITLINNEATFCIAAATEMFMEYLVTEGFQRARRDKRKTIYYKDLASTVNEIEQFEFLDDVIPQTMTLTTAMKRREEALEGENVNKKQKTSTDDSASLGEVTVSTNEPLPTATASSMVDKENEATSSPHTSSLSFTVNVDQSSTFSVLPPSASDSSDNAAAPS